MAETVADIVAAMRLNKKKERYYGTAFHLYADRIEAAAKRAWNEVDDEVRWQEDTQEVDAGRVRRVMNGTLGDYYE